MKSLDKIKTTIGAVARALGVSPRDAGVFGSARSFGKDRNDGRERIMLCRDGGKRWEVKRRLDRTWLCAPCGPLPIGTVSVIVRDSDLPDWHQQSLSAWMDATPEEGDREAWRRNYITAALSRWFPTLDEILTELELNDMSWRHDPTDRDHIILSVRGGRLHLWWSDEYLNEAEHPTWMYRVWPNYGPDGGPACRPDSGLIGGLYDLHTILNHPERCVDEGISDPDALGGRPRRRGI